MSWSFIQSVIARLSLIVSYCLLLCVLSVSIQAAAATEAKSFVVVSHIDSSIPVLTSQQLKGIFLGKRQEVHGLLVQPLDMEQWQGVKQAFYTQLVRKNASQLNAYWARKLFTGRGKPPRAFADSRALYHYLRKNKDAIAYMSPQDVDLSRVKIIYR